MNSNSSRSQKKGASAAAVAGRKRRGYFGIEIGGTKIQVVAGNEELQIEQRRRSTVDRGLGAAGIRQQIQSALSELLMEFDAIAAGVGFGGPVDWNTGRTSCSHHIG